MTYLLPLLVLLFAVAPAWASNITNPSAGGSGGAPTGATYITQTPNATLSAEQALSALGTGLMSSTTVTGVVSIYGGSACGVGTDAVNSISAAGVVTCITPGGGAPTDATYWVGAAHASLSAEINLGVLGTGLVINTSGTPSIKGTNTCTNQFPRSDNASGTWTCASVANTDLAGSIAASKLVGTDIATVGTITSG